MLVIQQQEPVMQLQVVFRRGAVGCPCDCSWGDAWDAESGDFYMKFLPADPDSDQAYSYAQNTVHDFVF